MQEQQGRDRHGDAPGRQQRHDPPVYRAVEPVHAGPDGLGQPARTGGPCRRPSPDESKEQNQGRRHQRPAAYPGHADQETHDRPRIEYVHPISNENNKPPALSVQIRRMVCDGPCATTRQIASQSEGTDDGREGLQHRPRGMVAASVTLYLPGEPSRAGGRKNAGGPDVVANCRDARADGGVHPNPDAAQHHVHEGTCRLRRHQ